MALGNCPIFLLILSLLVVFCNGYHVPTINCDTNTNSVNGSFPKFRYANASVVNTTASYQQCRACLYAKEGDKIWYKSCANEYDTYLLFGAKNVSTFLQHPDFCGSKLKCYVCYKDKCTDENAIYSMIPIPRYTPNSFKCYHGELEYSQIMLIECPSKQCISFYNFDNNYYGTTCYGGTEDWQKMFPKVYNLTTSYYFCNTSECNGYYWNPIFNGFQTAGMINPLLNYNGKNNQKIWSIKSKSKMTNNGEVHIIGKIMPNATKFQLIAHDNNPYYRTKPIMKLLFNLKKSYVAYIDVDKNREHRKPFLSRANSTVEIIFNDNGILIDGKATFEMLDSYENLGAIVYSGEWVVINAKRILSNKTTIVDVKDQKSPPTNTFNCAMDPQKHKYFTKPIAINDNLSFNLTAEYGIFDLALHHNPCMDSNIYTFLRFSWAPENITKNMNVVQTIKSKLDFKDTINEIIPSYLKISAYSVNDYNWKGTVAQHDDWWVYNSTIRLWFYKDRMEIICLKGGGPKQSLMNVTLNANQSYPNYIYLADPLKVVNNLALSYQDTVYL